MSHINIIPLQFSQVGSLEQMLETIGDRFKRETRLVLHPMDLTEYFDPVRSQYNANAIISILQPDDISENKIVGITDLDLFIPVLSYIFGQAYLGGSAALISGYRLQNSRYGLPDDQQVYEQRLLKCILHELGHTFGLRHCLHPGCIMISSTYVEEMDQKTDRFCRDCHKELLMH